MNQFLHGEPSYIKFINTDFIPM